jgi:subtilisin-like proprotein convertase family protein
MSAIKNEFGVRILDRQWSHPDTQHVVHGLASGLAYLRLIVMPASVTEVASPRSLEDVNKYVLAMSYGMPIIALGETNQPWTATVHDVPLTGYAGDYGLQKVWREGLRGHGVKVGVNDAALVRGHADFDYARVDSDSYLFSRGEKNGAFYQHGTAVAGIVGAQANGLGVIGVAHESTLWTAELEPINFVKSALDAACDVVNYSWGLGGGAPVEQLSVQRRLGVEFDSVSQGRDGLGMSLVFSAGDNKSVGADTALQATTYHENVITVAAVTLYAKATDHSSPGETVHVAAPGDRVAVANADDLTGHSLLTKSGTGYAAPFVSGVVALMYQANAALGLRDVQAILAHSASLPQSGMESFSFNGGTHANGGGLPFSRYYGFGLVNARMAVRLAQSWFAGGAQAQTPNNRQYTELSPGLISVVDNHHVSMFSIAGPRETEHVKLRLDLDVSDIKDLRVELISPRGTTSVLMDNYGNQNRALSNVIDFGSRRFWGEDVAGDWFVSVSSNQGRNVVRSAKLIFSGSADSRDDRYVYTDAFNALAVDDPGRLRLEDSDGGNDTFNAACLTSDAMIDLRAGTFRFADGPLGHIAAGTVIETVVGGDGHDLIIGSDAVSHSLLGGRGNDTLSGGAGADTLSGGAGADSLSGGLGDDTYTIDSLGDVIVERAGEGMDRVNSSVSHSLADNLEWLVLTGDEAISGTGNALNNLLSGNTADNVLSGGTGHDVLDGGAGNDSLSGGEHAEIYLGGRGNDTIDTGAGNDILLFNAGDGQDTVVSRGGSKTLSLGGDFAYSDLAFSKTENHLQLKIGAADQITFEDWYAATASRPVVNLQVIAEAMTGFNAGGSDPLLDQKIEQFDFSGMVDAFDAEQAANPVLSAWSLTHALSRFHLSGSDSAAFGGDLAYQYGRHGTLTGIGLAATQAVLGDSNLGIQAQVLNSCYGLMNGAVHLS